MSVTLNIREVDEAIVKGIEVAAKSAGFRSREAFLRSFLERSFGVDGNVTLGISERFRATLKSIIELGAGYALQPPPTVASIARALGHLDTSQLDATFRGDVPLSFVDGDRFCDLFGVNRTWLENGDLEPFAQSPKYRSPLDLFHAVYKSGSAYSRMFFVLSNERRGEAAVFGQSTNTLRFDLLLRDVPIHDDVGAGGASDLDDFCLFLAALDKRLLPARSDVPPISTSGRLLTPPENRRLVHGEVHPAQFLDFRKGSSHWAEDLWDLEYGGTEYSPNYTRARALYRRSMELEEITTNAALVQHIQSSRLKLWQTTDVELIDLMKETDPLDDATYDAYQKFINRAKADDKCPEYGRLLQLFNHTTIPLPCWLARLPLASVSANSAVTGHKDPNAASI